MTSNLHTRTTDLIIIKMLLLFVGGIALIFIVIIVVTVIIVVVKKRKSKSTSSNSSSSNSSSNNTLTVSKEQLRDVINNESLFLNLLKDENDTDNKLGINVIRASNDEFIIFINGTSQIVCPNGLFDFDYNNPDFNTYKTKLIILSKNSLKLDFDDFVYYTDTDTSKLNELKIVQLQN